MGDNTQSTGNVWETEKENFSNRRKRENQKKKHQRGANITLVSVSIVQKRPEDRLALNIT